jgi:hypothetical protein
MNFSAKAILSVVLHTYCTIALITTPARAQVQQGLPTQLKPDYRFPNPNVQDSKNSSKPAIEKDTFGRPINNPKDPKDLKKDDKNTTIKKDPKDLKKNTEGAKKENSFKDDFSTGVRCFNCGTIISVTESRKKAKPIWMTTTDPTDATTPEQAAKNAERNIERMESRSTEEFQKSANSSVKMNGTLTKPNTDITLQRKLGFETIVKMDDGSIKTVVTALQPAYNIGAKVRVIGNSLNPR